jgi:hypothetical protein
VSFRILVLLLFVEHNSDQYPENKYIEVYKGFACEIMRKSFIISSVLLGFPRAPSPDYI